MEKKYSLERRVPLSVCDETGRLGMPGAFRWFMDMAAEHAEVIGRGATALMERNLFWLTVRTRIRILRAPELMEQVTIVSWPEKPGAARTIRDYTICAGDELLVAGKTEWAVMDFSTGKLLPLQHIYPDELTEQLNDETLWSEPFSRIDADFSNDEILGVYTVSSADIDIGKHMNNAAYPRMIFGMFSTQELRARPITDAELCFRAPCLEGQELTVRIRRGAEQMDLGVFDPDGKNMLLARLR